MSLEFLLVPESKEVLREQGREGKEREKEKKKERERKNTKFILIKESNGQN